VYSGNDFDSVTAATSKFSDNNNDPKANIITAYNFAVGQVNTYTFIYSEGSTLNASFDSTVYLYFYSMMVPLHHQDYLTISWPSPL
jgi:hypothetical protein